jgi:hypothetical protein
MRTLNAKGHKERKELVKQGTNPTEAFKQALSDPKNQSTFKQGRKK